MLNLLNAIFQNVGQSPIQKVILQETRLDPELIGLKSCRLDVRASTCQGEQVNVEVQLANEGNMESRSLFYWSKLFTSQLHKGDDYSKLKRTIAVNILDFRYFGGLPSHNLFRIRDEISRSLLTELLEIHFIQLPLLGMEDELDLEDPFTRWLLFLSDRTDPRVKEEILMKDRTIQKAHQDLEALATDGNARRMYELREKALLDLRSGLNHARREGHQQGLEQGLEQGLDQGLELGRMEEKARLARLLLEQGFSEDAIIHLVGMSKTQMAAIKGE